MVASAALPAGSAVLTAAEAAAQDVALQAARRWQLTLLQMLLWM